MCKILNIMILDNTNDIIRKNLAINVDLTSDDSWINANTDLNVISLSKWDNAISDNINLIDFGLTGFDFGLCDKMWSGLTITPNESKFKLQPISYNEVINPNTGTTTGVTINTVRYPITPIITSYNNDRYFNLTGGYLHGNFKLEGYDYSLLPNRFLQGITIETMLYLNPDSYGMFYMMGVRSEDKYNKYFSGETITGNTNIGVITSDGNYLNSITGTEVYKKNYSKPEENKEYIYNEANPIENLKNNLIGFEITENGNIGYQYINEDGLIIFNHSNKTLNVTGYTLIDIVFKPEYNIISDDKCNGDNKICNECRLGKLIFFVNGRVFWIVDNFHEFYFRGLINSKEKQLGVPYSISWGGGSFGLKHSWHYDYQTYILYLDNDSNYINNNFVITENPVLGTSQLSGFTLNAVSNIYDINENIMQITYTGGSGTSYYIKYNKPISVLSNREYVIEIDVLNNGIFKQTKDDGSLNINKIKILPYSNSTDITVVNETYYESPILKKYKPSTIGLYPFPDGQEYQYIGNDVMYDGVSGEPVYVEISNNEHHINNVVTGTDSWSKIICIFKIKDNSGQKFVDVGILVESSDELNINKSIYVKTINYTASDILVKDVSKNNLLIEQNFNKPFYGGIQKLRIYDNALSNSEVFHNALIESRKQQNLRITKGGRLIYK